MKTVLLIFSGIFFMYGCKTKQDNKPAAQKPVKKILKRTQPAATIAYHFEKPRKWLQQNKENATAIRSVMALNRTDLPHLKSIDSILIPNDVNADIAYYLPFPLRLFNADSISKVIFFSYPSQSFAAYEYGDLVYTGPTNMGRKTDPTPTGLYFTNWKAEKTTSTFDDEWELKWNFNIQNKEGIGWHEYELPGYPASHSCLRLLEADAKYLYTWADQWVLDHDTVKLKGTPVIVFGTYDFNKPKPWLQLSANAGILNINENDLQQILSPYLQQILTEQQKRK